MQVWVLSDGAAGNEKPALALAQRFDGAARIWRLQARAPWRWLSPRRLPAAARAFGDEFRRALAQPPTLAIGCGRQAALATRLLRERGSRAVQLLDPRIDPAHWDIVIAPRHDPARGDNVLNTLGSLHAIDDDWLARARREWPDFAALPTPRTAVLIGGPTDDAPFTPADWDALCRQLAAWFARDGGSLLLTTSRRTPAWLRERARQSFPDLPGRRWTGAQDGDNPYAGLLGWADRLLATADSVNLLSEAAATGKPVYSPLPGNPRGRVGRFHANLIAAGHLRPMSADPQPWTPTPLRELDALVRQLRVRLDLPPAARSDNAQAH